MVFVRILLINGKLLCGCPCANVCIKFACSSEDLFNSYPCDASADVVSVYLGGRGMARAALYSSHFCIEDTSLSLPM